jgi:sterol desaturase/sphingolipid hydroxylase (fatty acid hydroxylase superfamily)
MSSHAEIDTNPNPDSVRLFESDFLEFFTHISPVTIIVMWVPVILFLFVRSVQAVSGGQFWHIPLGIVVGLLMWTVAEYLLHRYLFHYEPTTPRMERLFYLFHGVHHHQPQDKTRLVMPLPLSIPLAILFYGLFYLVLATLLGLPAWVNPVMIGFMVGYLAYDLIHYATHHFPMRSRLGKYLKRHHMIHHYKAPDARFGVSSPLWDLVMGTMTEDKK